MEPNSREELTPGLARQLSRLEQIGNAEARLSQEERAAARPRLLSKRVAQVKQPPVGERQHRRQTLAHRYHREAQRARRFAMVLLLLFPVFTVCYVIAGYYNRSGLALVALLLGGLAIGFALPTLYLARKRQEKLDRKS